MHGTHSSLHPLRPPDWRYCRSHDLLASHRSASLRSDDLWIRRLLSELRSRRRGAGPRAQAAGHRCDPAIATALELYAGDDPLRPVVEAYLLAAAPLSLITERSGLTAAEIEAYHACFFDVGDRLARPDYIVRHVILGGATWSAAARSIQTALKLAAYLGGPRVLSGLLPTPRPQAEHLADLLPRLEETNDGLIALCQHLALLGQSAVGAEAAREALLQHVRRQAALRRDEDLNEYQRSVMEILSHVKFRMRQKEDVEKCPPELRPYFHGAVEMRSDELMHYQLTGELPPLEKFLHKFPDPPAREAGAAGGGGDA